MSQPRQRRRMLIYTVVVLVAIPCLLFCATLVGLLPWSPVNCWHHDVDIHSGRVRYTRYVFWIPVRQKIEDSSLTKALHQDDLGGITAEWHHAMTFSPGLRHSPHYIFHSAINQIRELELSWSLADFTPEARRASARRVLQLWQQTGSDSGAGDYLRALGESALSADGKTNRIAEADLPRL
jgi:hypothetical protein